MRIGAGRSILSPMNKDQERAEAVPCLARPSTGFFHPDGRCECFFGGPAPEFEQPEMFAA
ncbi:MAG: hypothetical protein JWP95_1366 [Actinotalea sp.]|nr:hypothetical protein [Actinotalea sp.]